MLGVLVFVGLSHASCSSDNVGSETFITTCPLSLSVIENPSSTSAQLANWTLFSDAYNISNGNYGNKICPPGVSIQNCPYGIAWRESQCTCNAGTPSQSIDPRCVQQTRLNKLKKIIA